MQRGRLARHQRQPDPGLFREAGQKSLRFTLGRKRPRGFCLILWQGSRGRSLAR